jgi:hypothetical protein
MIIEGFGNTAYDMKLQAERARLDGEAYRVINQLVKSQPKMGGHACRVEGVTIVIEGRPRERRPRREYPE